MRTLAIVACLALGTALIVAPHCDADPGDLLRSDPPPCSGDGEYCVADSDLRASIAPSPATSAPAATAPTTTTIPVSPWQLAAVDRTQAAQPLTAFLPHDDLRFSIDYKLRADGSPAFTITLKAVLNRPDQRDQWRAELAADKAAALAWLRAKGDPAQLSTSWRPPEAASL